MTLTKEIAEQFLKNEKSVDLSEFTSVEDAAAKSLVITDAAAQALAQYHRRNLCLDGLTSLSDGAALALSQHKGNLELNGLTILSDGAAQALSQHKGGLLELNGLTILSDGAAQALGQHEGSLGLRGLTSLSDAAILAFARHGGGSLDLTGLKNLSDVAIQVLAQHKDDVWLFGFETTAAKASVQPLGALSKPNPVLEESEYNQHLGALSKPNPVWEESEHDQQCEFCGGCIMSGDEIVVIKLNLRTEALEIPWHTVCYEEGLPDQELTEYQKTLWEDCH
jgi:hypothetical protein